MIRKYIPLIKYKFYFYQRKRKFLFTITHHHLINNFAVIDKNKNNISIGDGRRIIDFQWNQLYFVSEIANTGKNWLRL